MGRRESQLNPQAGALQQFAHDLRELRRDAGSPSYRQLAQIAHYSASALSTAANGRALPSLPVLEAYVRACGGDEEKWRLRWQELSDRTLAAAPAADHTERFAPRPPDVDAGPGSRSPRTAWRLPRMLIPAPVALAMTAVAVASVMAVGGPDQKAAEPLPIHAVDNSPAPGTACWPDMNAGHLLPEPTAQEPDADTEAPGEMDFATATTANHYWGSWLPKPPAAERDNLIETVTSDPQYQGKNTLRVEVDLGMAQIGSIHMPGLESRDTVTITFWYGGQGSAVICPFIQQSGTYLDYYPEVRALYLSPNSAPGWHTYQWKVPDLDAHHVQGTAIEIVNTGVAPVVFNLGAITW